MKDWMRCEYVTGAVDSGKTSRLLEMFRRDGHGCGVVSVKVFTASGLHVGYDALILPSRERMELCRLGMGETGAGRWRFRGDTFRSAGWRVLMDYLAFGPPVTIDEVGPLEARGGGWAPLLRTLAALDAPMRIGTRHPVGVLKTTVFDKKC